MLEMSSVIAIAAGAFVATNLDNFVLLVALFGRYSDSRPGVVSGYFAGMLVILTIAYSVGRIVGAAPVKFLGLLGIFPLLIGLFELARLLRKRGVSRVPEVSGGGRTAFVATLLTQLSNSSDTIVTFSALFSDENDLGDYLVLMVFAGMALLLAQVSYQTLRYPWLGRQIQYHGQYVTPLVLITVGLYILSNTALDMLPG